MLEKFRELCLSFPGASETLAWGHPNFRVHGRTFGVFEVYRERPCIAVKVGHSIQQLLIDDVSFFRTPYVGKHGWLSIWVDRKVKQSIQKNN